MTSMRTPAFVRAISGLMYCGIPGVVCRAIASQTRSALGGGRPWLLTNSRAASALSTSNRFVSVWYSSTSPVVKQRRDVQQFTIKLHIVPDFLQCTEEIHPDRMVE